MSLIQRVAAIIEDLGEGNADDVCREIGWEVSRVRVIQALQNARYTGLLESDGAKSPVKGSKAARLTTYRKAKPKDYPLPACSVWDYAQAFAQEPRRIASVWDLGAQACPSTPPPQQKSPAARQRRQTT